MTRAGRYKCVSFSLRSMTREVQPEVAIVFSSSVGRVVVAGVRVDGNGLNRSWAVMVNDA